MWTLAIALIILNIFTVWLGVRMAFFDEREK